MIFSPWGPYLDRVTPGADYDASKIRGASRNRGGFGALRLPHYLSVSTGAGITAVLERQYRLTGVGDAGAIENALGSLYGTEDGAEILRTGFMWFFDPTESWADLEASAHYAQILPGPVDGLKWYLQAGAIHLQAYDNLDQPANIAWPAGYAVPDWTRVWSLWRADDTASGNGGHPTATAQEGDSWHYPIFTGAIEIPDADAYSGFRTDVDFDLMRGADFRGVFVADALRVAPWFPRLEPSALIG